MRQSEQYSRRFRFAYSAATLAGFALTAGWAVVFAFMQWWLMAGMELAIAAVAVASFLMARRDRMTVALLVLQYAFLVFIMAFCLLFDTPSASAPRVTHHFLLVLAMLGYITYQHKRSLPQLFVIALSLVGFVVFASAPMVFSFARPIPDEFRTIGSWVNVSIAVAMLCGGIYALQREFARNADQARDIKTALKNRAFELFYQPQFDQSGALVGAEALLRWKKADHYISPAKFIPVAEEAGLMPDIGDWVLNEACRTLAFWQQEEETRELKLSVNISVDHFMRPGFVDGVLERVHALEIDPARLKLELTESMVVKDIDVIVAKMGALRTAGITISLDDFGTGYSSLSHLRSLPIQEIKIDRSFIQAAPASKRNRLVLKSIFDIARTLDLSTVAEGIETEDQFRLLQSFGCTIFQGFHFGRPVALSDFQRQWATEAPAELADSA